MSDRDVLDDALERLEWDDDRGIPPSSSLARVTRRAALTGASAGFAAVLLEACGGSAPAPSPSSSSSPSPTVTPTTGSSGTPASSVFGSNQAFNFTVVNHATTSDFFTPTRYGAADACRLLGCTYQWAGSQTSSIPGVVDAINAAVSEKVSGIATTLIDPTAFNTAVADALSAGIPVVAYNSDAPTNPRLAYIGQDLYLSGQTLGEQIVALLPHGGDIAIFASTPGSSNVQPRIDGIRSVLKGHRGIKHRVIGSGATEAEQVDTIAAYIYAHPTFRGFFAVDGGSTAAVGQAIQKYGLHARGVVSGGYDVSAVTQTLIAAGDLTFTIDQQPYLQGFLPILELYLYNVSAKLTGIADVDTGCKVIDRSALGPYSTTTSRFEGTGSAPGVQKS